MTHLMTDSREIKSKSPFSRIGWRRILVFKENVNAQNASPRSEVIRGIIGQELDNFIPGIWWWFSEA